MYNLNIKLRFCQTRNYVWKKKKKNHVFKSDVLKLDFLKSQTQNNPLSWPNPKVGSIHT
jgi:hypothetical protein